jgi:hypothetical protein
VGLGAAVFATGLATEDPVLTATGVKRPGVLWSGVLIVTGCDVFEGFAVTGEI